MSLFFWLLISAHIFLCFSLILLVLIQNDKSGGLGGAFGGSAGGGGAFGGAGAATFITKATTRVAFVFMFVVLALNFVVSGKDDTAAQNKSMLQEASQSQNSGLGSIVPVAPGELPSK